METDNSPQMSDQYDWDLERPEKSQEVLERFDVRLAKQIITKTPRPVESVDLQKYGDVFREYLEGVGIKPDVDWSTIDVDLPVIFIRTAEGKTPIDGRHRLAKALREGRDSIPAVLLTADESNAVQIM